MPKPINTLNQKIKNTEPLLLETNQHGFKTALFKTTLNEIQLCVKIHAFQDF